MLKSCLVFEKNTNFTKPNILGDFQIYLCTFNRCSWKFRNIHTKTPVLESLFTKVAGLNTCNVVEKRPRHRCFPRKLKVQRVHVLSKNLLEKLLKYFWYRSYVLFTTAAMLLELEIIKEWVVLHSVHNRNVLLFALY